MGSAQVRRGSFSNRPTLRSAFACLPPAPTQPQRTAAQRTPVTALMLARFVSLHPRLLLSRPHPFHPFHRHHVDTDEPYAAGNLTTGHTKCNNIIVSAPGWDPADGGFVCICPTDYLEVAGRCVREDGCATPAHNCAGTGVECATAADRSRTDDCICKTGFAEVDTNANRNATDPILCQE